MENQTELEEALDFWNYKRPSVKQNMFYAGDDKPGVFVYLVKEEDVFYSWDSDESLLPESEYDWKPLGVKYNPNQIAEIYA